MKSGIIGLALMLLTSTNVFAYPSINQMVDGKLLQAVTYGDINGDGYVDGVLLRQECELKQEILYSYGGYSERMVVAPNGCEYTLSSFALSTPDNGYTNKEKTIGILKNYSDHKPALFIRDVNADGDQDIIVHTFKDGKLVITIFHNEENNFTSSTK